MFAGKYLLELRSIYLVSGDADFVPALSLLKSQKKEILTAMVPRGYSFELRQKFPYFILKREVLISCMRGAIKK